MAKYDFTQRPNIDGFIAAVVNVATLSGAGDAVFRSSASVGVAA